MTPMRTIGLAQVTRSDASVAEAPCGYTVRLPVRGFAQDELELDVSDSVVTVRGDQVKTPTDGGPFVLHERLEESFELPADADTQHVTANYVDGVLVVEIARFLRLTPRRCVNPEASGV
jgi:HSP20 family molecular chaperone IbpA